ncbi:hypothetical protein BKA70DRAFT_526593 [Coprinopsis sp. MPI-PUGE-AT-0042]|nr:hypothetical protein BKA70DRAFT_526593 [Coprinopsis sp. MPI-PUGE-AT-0042]
MTPQLPPELIREVSRNFSRSEDVKTLQNAALVSPAFRRPFQEIIFSTVKIRKQHLNQNNSAHHLAGIDIFRRNSVLITYVRTVSIKNAAGCPPFVNDASPIPPCMVELIQLIPTQFINSFTYVGWDGPIGEGFEDAIINLVGSPQLRTLTLTSVPLEICRFVVSPSLKTLAYRMGSKIRHPPLMIAERLSQSPSATKTRSTAPIRLDLHSEPSVIENLTSVSSVIDLRAVKFLKLASDGFRRGNIWLVSARCAPTLRTLSISTDNIKTNVFSEPAASEALGRLVILRKLEIMCGDHFGLEEANNPFPDLAPFLHTFPSQNSISKIRFRVRFGGRCSSFAEGKQFWDRIDQILCNRSRFPRLKILHFEITLVRDLPLDKPGSEEYEQEEGEYWSACKMAGIDVYFLYTVKLRT